MPSEVRFAQRSIVHLVSQESASRAGRKAHQAPPCQNSLLASILLAMGRHVFEECNLDKRVAEKLPDTWSLRVFKCISGDSGNTYFTQILILKTDLTAGRWERAKLLCDCFPGKFVGAPLTIAEVNEPCKHGTDLVTTLSTRAKKNKRL